MAVVQTNVHQRADCNARPRVPILLRPCSYFDAVESSAKISIFSSLSLYGTGRNVTRSASALMKFPGRYEKMGFFSDTDLLGNTFGDERINVHSANTNL